MMILLAFPVMADTDIVAAPAVAPVQVNPEQYGTKKHQAILEQRVITKWDALIRKDFASAYSLTSPAYRNLFSLDAFRRQFSVGKVVWKRIDVVDVKFKDDDAATVGINIHFVYHQPQGGDAIEMKTYTQEPWVRVNGQWWYLVEGKT